MLDMFYFALYSHHSEDSIIAIKKETQMCENLNHPNRRSNF
jgi:hypothetical protein